MRHKTSPSLASCDFPWTALLLLAAESLLPLTVVSCFACLASVSFTGLSSSGFLCVETDQDKGLKAELIAIFCTSTPIMQITDTEITRGIETKHQNHLDTHATTTAGNAGRWQDNQSCESQRPQQVEQAKLSHGGQVKGN